jgi:dsDNA-specific endonuclease/ATPase MutS2
MSQFIILFLQWKKAQELMVTAYLLTSITGPNLTEKTVKTLKTVGCHELGLKHWNTNLIKSEQAYSRIFTFILNIFVDIVY